MRQHESSKEKKCKVYRYKSKLHLLVSDPNMFTFGLPSVISKASVADSEHVFVCWGRYFRIRRTAVVLILKYVTQQPNTYSKSTTETLKQDVKSFKS